MAYFSVGLLINSRLDHARALNGEWQLLVDSIDDAMKELHDHDHEQKFIKHRYFQNWSIHKTAESLGYSEQHVFRVRNDVLEKLLIALRGIIVYESL